MDGHPALVFRLHEGAPTPVREVLLERGWEEYDEEEQEAGDWNLYWRASAFRNLDYENLLPWQRLNHHPKTVDIMRKDCLARDLRRMRGTYGSSLYNFSPPTFILPNDYTRFLVEYTKHRPARGGGGGGGGSSSYWICKPVDLSRGRGIFIFEDIKDLAYSSSVIVQRYISNPLLISGYKFDLRIYVGVKSFHPLTVYMYQEGLVRFATVKYNLSYLDDLYAHLTNTSINKLSPFYTTNKERVGHGCTWTMSKFRYFLQSQGINELLLWQKINNIVTLTLLAVAPSVPSTPNCVELFGFDILIDSKFKPWLLEVNYSPALTPDCQVDVKKGLINDLIDLMDYRWMDSLREKGYRRERYKRPCYLSSQTPLLPNPNYSQLQPHHRRNSSQSSHTLPKTVCDQPQSHKRISNGQSLHTHSLPLPKAICQPQSHKRRSHRQSNPHTPLADHRRYLPPLDLNRICSARGYVINTNITTATKASANQGLNPILGPHSRTTTAAVNRRPRPALAARLTENGALNTSEVTERDNDDEAEMDGSEDGDVSSMKSDSPQQGLRGLRDTPAVVAPLSAGACRLPDIHSPRQRAGRRPRDASGAPGREETPPVRVGDFILTYPFNTATLRASQNQLNVKTALQEIHKLMGRLAAGCGQPEKKRRRGEEEMEEEDGRRCLGKEEEFESLFWGPKDPPLLSDAASPVT